MNKKGFTLVELLATLAILSIIMGIAVISYNLIVDRSKTKSFEFYEKTMYTETMNFLMDSLIDSSSHNVFPKNNEIKRFTLPEMIENNIIDPFNNPRNHDDSCPNSYVEVKREDKEDVTGNEMDSLKFKVCLICTESNYNVDGNNCLFIPEDGKGDEWLIYNPTNTPNNEPTSSPSSSSEPQVPDDLVLRNIIVRKFNEGASYIEKYNPTTNGIAIDTPDGSGSEEVYYYTSSWNNNLSMQNGNVVFGEFCWQIIRTTTDGGVKLIYNGPKTSDNKCPNNNASRPTSIGVIGSLGVKTTTVSGSKLYGTSFEIINDGGTNKFKLKNTNTYSWSNETYKNIVGKFSCLSTSDTCTVLYYIGHYQGNTMASTTRYTIGNNAHFSQIGTSSINAFHDSPALVGYMYNDTYNYLEKTIPIYSRGFLNYKSMSSSNQFYYGDNAVWVEDHYELKLNGETPTTKTSWSEIRSKAAGMYTCMSTSSTSCTTVYYIVTNTTGSYMYSVPLTNNEDVNEKSVTMTIGTGYEKNGNVYSLTGVSTLKILLKDWYTNYSNYKDYYICDNFSSSTCTNTVGYVGISNSYKIDYNLINNTYVFGNSVTYSNGEYIINTDTDTSKYQSIWEWQKKYNTINSSHYTCFEKYNPTTRSCGSSIYYVFYTKNTEAYYIELTNGETIEDAMEKMLNINNSSTSSLNKYNSAIKGIVDSWYESNLLHLSNFLDHNAIFCNNRNISSYNGWSPLGNTTSDLAFAHGGHTGKNLACPNLTDRFSTNNNLAKLKYPVGLMSGMEHMFISNYYAVTGQNYWLLSPMGFGYSGAGTRTVSSNGTYASTNSNYPDAVRPVIVLKPGITITSGNGTYDSPYIIDILS